MYEHPAGTCCSWQVGSVHPLLLWVMLFCCWEQGKEEEGTGICIGIGIRVGIGFEAGIRVGVEIRVGVGVGFGAGIRVGTGVKIRVRV